MHEHTGLTLACSAMVTVLNGLGPGLGLRPI